MNFYQNKIWRTISNEIFKKDIFEIFIFGKKYWGVKKTHKKFGLKFNWFQVLGVKIPENITENDFIYEIKNLKKDFGNIGNIFFQFGFINTLKEPFYENRELIQKEFVEKYGLYPTIKENMPEATVIVDLKNTEEEMYKSFNKSAKRNINKSIKNNLYFKIADKKEIEDFYTLWYETSKLKGFNIYSKNEYIKLMDFLRSNGSGNLYIIKKDNMIISGSIEISEKNYSYYLYGATNRDFINIGGHYFLKYEMFKYFKEKGIKKVDLLGVSPNGYKNHHLSGVSQFKNSLGGKHIEYIGNFDLPLNIFVYKLLRLKFNH